MQLCIRKDLNLQLELTTFIQSKTVYAGIWHGCHPWETNTNI